MHTSSSSSSGGEIPFPILSLPPSSSSFSFLSSELSNYSSRFSSSSKLDFPKTHLPPLPTVVFSHVPPSGSPNRIIFHGHSGREEEEKQQPSLSSFLHCLLAFSSLFLLFLHMCARSSSSFPLLLSSFDLVRLSVSLTGPH